MSNELIACCGLYCGACSFKVAFEEQDRVHITNMPSRYDYLKDGSLEACRGCRMEHRCGECAIRDCVFGRNIDDCSMCDEFPCQKLIDFNNDGVPHHAEAIGNLEKLKVMGHERWLALQEACWQCSCGERLSWYRSECTNH